MLSNPNIAQAMNEALNNPQMVDLMIQANPMLRNNPQAREIIQSPFFRSMLTNPDTLRAVAQMRRSMGGGAGGEAFPAPGATDTTPAGAAAAGAEGGLNPQQMPFPMFGGMFGPGGAGAGAGAGFGAGAGAGGAGAGAGANPFMALMNPFGAPPTAPQTGAAPTAPGDSAAQPPAGTTTPAGQAGSNPTSPPPNPFGGLFGAPQGAPAANPFGMTPEMMQNFMQMMGGGGGGGMPGEAAAPTDTRPPEERYADQLSQLNEMGFFDFDQNVSALRRSGGNVQGAVNFLLGG